MLSRFERRGFTFTDVYEPDPPVVSLTLPVALGQTWSGSWEDRNGQIDGSYRIEVTARRELDIAGRTVSAFRLDVATDFRGEYEGRSDIAVWLDIDTNTMLRSSGQLELEGAFGSFATRFRVRYLSGPAYRD